MSTTTPVSFRRYRRRIVVVGAAAFLIIFAIGAVFALPALQNDLEDRVEDELVAQDIGGVTASFSGQDGTLVCSEPLADAGRAVRVGEQVDGVRAIALDSTCVDGDDGTATTTPTASSTASTSVGDTAAAATTAASSTTLDEPDLSSITEVLAEDPLFDQLSQLVADAGLGADDLLGTQGPITLFAPTDAAFDDAFDTLGADTFGTMTSDPELLRSLLLQHITDGALTSDGFVDGPVEMLDGSTVEVDATTPSFASGGSTAGVADPDTQLDIAASNGVIHAIDAILIPADFPVPAQAPSDDTVPPPADPAVTRADYSDGIVVLSGAVADDGQRGQLRSAAESDVDAANVVDELNVVAEGPGAGDIDELAVGVQAMVNNFVSGEARLDDGEITLSGAPFDAAGRAAVEELADSTGTSLELSARPIADPDSAEQLEEELNDFVRANPIEFEDGSLELTAESVPIVEQVAARALRLQGTDIVVVGFTDTAGSAERNELLSTGRAQIVRDILIERGASSDAVSAEGSGETAPILRADGSEDGEASRRIEFEVTSR